MNNSEIIKRFDEQEFVLATIDQITKDFLKVGIKLEFLPEHTQSAGSLIEYLNNELEIVMREAPSLLTRLFYLVDIPETNIREIFDSSDLPSRDLADLLLLRAAQKVYFREKYKSSSL
ncbi:MAG: hypothetical protein R3277_01305 [Brumimicrobium sp.]|nr:hypothetical protein [Brumimicrobium sp.]